MAIAPDALDSADPTEKAAVAVAGIVAADLAAATAVAPTLRGS